MKVLLKICWLNIKNNRYIIFALLMSIYLLILPLILSNQSYQDDVIMTWFLYMQKLLMIPMLIFIAYLFKPFVEIEYLEIINSIHRKSKLFYLIGDICFVQVLMIPFYSILIFTDKQIIPYIFFVIMQFIVLASLYYLITTIVHSTTSSLGVLFIYILLFSLILSEISIMNLFVVVAVVYISPIYYWMCFFIIVVANGLGYILEKNF